MSKSWRNIYDPDPHQNEKDPKQWDVKPEKIMIIVTGQRRRYNYKERDIFYVLLWRTYSISMFSYYY